MGPSRLKHYLVECAGDQSVASQLYHWNTEVAGAFWESLGHLEVALRNTIDDRMCARQVRLGRAGRHWIFDDHYELGRSRQAGGQHRRPYVDVDQAQRRVRQNKKAMSADQILSEISFGFWHQMVSRHQMRLWPDIASGFPHAPSRNQALVHDIVADLRDLRNRIGHHHRIWNIDLPRRYAQLLDLAGYTDPDLRAWIDEHSRVSGVLARRPGAQ